MQAWLVPILLVLTLTVRGLGSGTSQVMLSLSRDSFGLEHIGTNMIESSVEDLLVEYVLRHRVKSNTALVSSYQRHTSEYCVVQKELIKFSANLPRDRDCLAFMMG